MLDTEEDQSKVDEKFDELTGRGFTPDEIAEMEKNAIDGAVEDIKSQPEKAEADTINDQISSDDFFRNEAEKNEGKGRFRAFASRNRGKTTIGIVAIILCGGGFGLFSMLAGPLQFIQIAKLLQGFHFSSQEDLSDDRMMRIARYIRYNNNPEKLRLGILGNKYADSLEKKINKSGLETGYTDRLGYFDGYIIDPNNLPPGSELDNIHAKTPEELAQKLAAHYDVPVANIDLDTTPGKVRVSADGLGYFKSSRLMRVSLQDAGYSKVGSAIRSRIMGKRGGLDWHPIKKLDKKILTTLDARLKKWAADRESRIRNGATDNPTITPGNDADTDGDGTPDAPSEEAKAAAADANKINEPSGDIAPSASAADTDVANIKSKLGKAAGISAVVGLVCLAEGIADNVDQIKQSNVVLPLMRLGGEGLSVGNQLMTGQDIDLEQLGALSKKLYSDEDGSWASARSIQAELGKELTGPDIGSEAEISNERNIVSEVLNNIPLLSGVCDVANSTIGQIITTGLDIFTGPAAAAAGTIISQALGPKAVDAFARWLAGHPIDINVAGANFGNYINYGARLAADDSIIASGGVELDDEQSLELKQHRIAVEQEARQEKGLLARLFDPTDTTSIAGSFISEQSPDPAQNIARAVKAVPSSMASIFKLPFLGTKKAKAASSYDYGFPEYGFSLSDINRSEIKNPFENEKEVVAILKGAGGSTYRTRAVDCFGVSIQTDGSVRSLGKVPAFYEIKGKSCNDTSLEWLRVRFFILDSQLMEAYACYENDTSACGEFGLDGSSNTNGSGSTGVAVADLTGPVIPCQGNPREIKRDGAGVDWSGITPTGSIGKNSAGQEMNVYIRDACAGQTKVRTVVIGATIHAGGESGGQVVAHELLFNEQLPPDVRIIAIPVINGSGFTGQSRTSRLNKNAVNLNRNFDYRWSEADESISGDISPGGNYKGPSAASEPETQAIQNFLTKLGKTSLVISYHSATDYVSSSGPKRAVSERIGRRYSQLTEQEYTGNSGFGFFEAWYNYKTETPAMLIELSSDKSFDYLNKHADAVVGVLSENVVE